MDSGMALLAQGGQVVNRVWPALAAPHDVMRLQTAVLLAAFSTGEVVTHQTRQTQILIESVALLIADSLYIRLRKPSDVNLDILHHDSANR